MVSTQQSQFAWQSELCQHLKEVERYWLSRPGALTEGLRKVGDLDIQVLREYVDYADTDDATPLNLRPKQAIWAREILMSINQRPAIFARSITELTASRDAWQGVRTINQRPLADILYHDPEISRSRFESARLGSNLSLQQALDRYGDITEAELLARRSTFIRANQGLTVNEVFLSGFWEELAKHPYEQQISF